MTKEQAIQMARDVLGGRYGDVVVLDTETTGFDIGAEMIEISAYHVQSGKTVSRLLRPASFVPESIERLTGITNKILLAENDVFHYELEIKNFLNEKVWVGYNVSFDLRMIHQTFLIHSIKFPPVPVLMVDAMVLASNYFQVFNSVGGYKWFKLAEACERLGVAPEGRYHRSMADTMATYRVLDRIASAALDGDECHKKDMTNVTIQKREDTLYL